MPAAGSGRVSLSAMNRDHQLLCSSDDWAVYLRTELVPWGLDGVPLGGRVLELGGGYGASTAYLVERSGDLTVLEADKELADGLTDRFPGTLVIWGDATAIAAAAGTFDAVVCFTMLHHVDTAAAQDRLFAEAARVLRARVASSPARTASTRSVSVRCTAATSASPSTRRVRRIGCARPASSTLRPSGASTRSVSGRRADHAAP